MMPSLADELVRRDGTAIVVRTRPLRVRWQLNAITTADGHELSCTWSASANSVDTPVDRRMLAEIFLSDRDVATARDVVQHFQGPLQSAAQRVARQHSAEALLGAERSAILKALQDAASSVGFACGLEMIGPFSLDVVIPTLDQQRRQALQQELLEQRAAAERARLQHASEALTTLQQMRASMPHLSGGQLLEAIPSSNRGLFLRQLMESDARSAAAIPFWCVAGPSLVRLDVPLDGEPVMQINDLPAALGPLRSLRWSQGGPERLLLVGAQRGIIVSRDLAEHQLFIAPDLIATTGFNSAVALPVCGCLFAAHGEAGLFRWDLNRPGEPRAIELPDITGKRDGAVFVGGYEPMKSAASGGSILNSFGSPVGDARRAGPRNLQSIGERSVIFSIGGQVCICDDNGQVRCLASRSTSNVIALLSIREQFVVVHEDGTLATVSSEAAVNQTIQVSLLQQRGSRLRAATTIAALDEQRLLLSNVDGTLVCVGIHDGLVTEFAGPHRDLRMLQATARAVAAVSSDRQRIVLWDSWEPTKPRTEVHVTMRARHRIADLSAGAAS